MPSNNEYKRYFIILQEDDKGYELAAGKVPTGYAKIEIKNGRGKLTAYAQNVRNWDRADYRMLLVAPNRKAAVDMGKIMVDATGRGELNVEFDADNVMKTGMNISDFMVAAVSANTGIPLSGYTGRDKMQWKGSYNIINKTYDRIDKTSQPIHEVVTPVQTAPMPAEYPQQAPVQMPPMAQMPQMPTMPNLGPIVEGAKNVIGNVVEDVVEGAKNVVGNVIEGAKDVAGEVYEGATDVIGDVVQGAKNIVGGVKQGVMGVAQEIVEDVASHAAMPAQMQQMPMQQMPMQQMPMQQMPMQQMPMQQMPMQQMPMQQMPMQQMPMQQMPMQQMPMQQMPMQQMPMQPAPAPIQNVKGAVSGAKKGKKEMVEEVAPEAIMPTPMQPAPAPIQPQVKPMKPQPVEIPIQTEVKHAPVQPVEIPIQPEVKPTTVQPIEIPIVVKPIVETPPVQPIIMAPKKPIYETETEVKAKFVIEAETQHEAVHYEPMHVECENIDYKDYYYDEECEKDSDSDSDSDSDDREREKHHEHHEKECEREHEHEHEHEHGEHDEHEGAVNRRLMKVLGRLRRYEPFDNQEDREDWFKIGDDIYLLNNAAIPFMGSMMPLGYPYMMNDCVMMIGRKDYIIGVKYDRDHDKKNPRQIMFGMPGMRNQQEEAFYRMRGFTRFRPHKSRNYGYWIMIVDLKTGRIITK